MRVKLSLVLFLSFILALFSSSFALEEKKVIRVGISNQSFSSWDYKEIKLTSVNIIKIIDMSQNIQLEPVEANKLIKISLEDNFYNIYVDDELKYWKLKGPLLLSSNAEIGVTELNRKGMPAKYKGMIEIRNSKNDTFFNVINVVDMQNYLRGVVPNEMPVSFGLEALKAQSIAARNYATNAAIAQNYDVVDSTASQVYYGANSYREQSDLAVAQTEGIYALYNEKPITALYFSTSGGITDDWDDVFGEITTINSHPYLKARFDKQGQKPLKTEADVIDFYSKTDGGFDTNSPKFRWNIEFTREELEEVLNQTLAQQSKTGLVTPSFDGSNKLIGLKEIKPLKRTQSGKITELEIVSKSGNYKVRKELAIRRVLKKSNAMLPSSNFFVQITGKEKLSSESENQKTPLEAASVKFFDNSETYPSKFNFIGGGFGHGVGMSQFGAYNLAKAGKKYPEILNHYYTNIKLSTFPKTVYFNDYNVHYKTDFYYDAKAYKSAYLMVDNRKGANEFPFKINDDDFSQTKNIANSKIIKINITQYLKDGLNSIDFAPLTAENKGKYVIYRVEFQ